MQQIHWATLPMLKVCLPFVLGIVISSIIEISVYYIAVALFISFFSMIFCKVNNGLVYRDKFFFFASFSFFILVGLGIAKACSPDNYNEQIRPFYGEKLNWKARVDKSQIKGKYNKLTVSLKNVQKGKKLIAFRNCRVYLYLSDTMNLPPLLSEISFRTYLNPIESTNNEFQFNLKEYLGYKHIFAQGFVRGFKVESISKSPLLFFAKAQKYWVSFFQKVLKDEKHQGIAIALILGNRDFLSEDVNQAFIESGAVHLLAVSGLHIGIVTFIFSFIIRIVPIYTSRWLRNRYLLIMLFVWLFIGLTGFQTATMRAGVMLSVYYFGFNNNKFVNGLNTLLTTAFLLLVYNPYWIYDIGFQLSFFAVLGIICLKPFFTQIWEPKNVILLNIWDSLTVCFAAQVAILPLLIGYFNQFSLYFWLGGSIGVYLAFLVLVQGITLMFLDLFLSVDMISILSIPLEFTIFLLYEFVEWITNLPLNHVSKLYIPSKTILFFNLGLVLTCFGIVMKKKYLLWQSIVLIFLGLFIFTKNKTSNMSKSFSILYPNRKGIILDYFDNGQLQTIKSESITKKNEEITTNDFRFAKYAKQNEVYKISPKTIGYQLGEGTVVFYKDGIRPPSLENDYLIIPPNVSLKNIANHLRNWKYAAVVYYSKISKRQLLVIENLKTSNIEQVFIPLGDKAVYLDFNKKEEKNTIVDRE